MERTSRAVVFPRPNEARVVEVDLPAMRDDEVLVDIAFSAVSPGTERSCLGGVLEATDGTPLTFPHVPGYQAAGLIREVGPAVKDLRPGDRVFSRNCRAPLGWQGTWWGGHVATHVADPSDVLVVPDGVSLRCASGLLLAQVGYNGASRVRLTPGDPVLVIGDGLVGQYAAQALRARGARVLLVGRVRSRLELAQRFSADEVFDAAAGDPVAFVRKHAPDGVAAAIDTTGTAAAVRQAVTFVRRGGDLVMNGYYGPADRCVDWSMLRARELSLHCPNSRTRARMAAALDLVHRGALRLEELVTHEMPAAESPEAYRLLADPSYSSLGILIRWSG
jgi:bacteriochlorophyllide a dehydrogenase